MVSLASHERPIYLPSSGNSSALLPGGPHAAASPLCRTGQNGPWRRDLDQLLSWDIRIRKVLEHWPRSLSTLDSTVKGQFVRILRYTKDQRHTFTIKHSNIVSMSNLLVQFNLCFVTLCILGDWRTNVNAFSGGSSYPSQGDVHQNLFAWRRNHAKPNADQCREPNFHLPSILGDHFIMHFWLAHVLLSINMFNTYTA